MKGLDKRQRVEPRNAAKALLAQLQARASARKAAAGQRYFKGSVTLYGVAAPVLHNLARELVKRVRNEWTARDAVRLCDEMVKDRHLEARGVGYLVVARFASQSGPGLLRDVRRWLERYCGNWALVDNLAPGVLTPLLECHPELIPEVLTWTRSPNQWLRRGVVIAFVPLARRGQRLSTAYTIATRLLGDGEDLMHKAVGWLLREAGKSDAARLERYLLARGRRLPRTTLRYAIERFSPRDRRRLLVATRG